MRRAWCALVVAGWVLITVQCAEIVWVHGSWGLRAGGLVLLVGGAWTIIAGAVHDYWNPKEHHR